MGNEWIGVHDVKFNQLEPIQSCKKKKSTMDQVMPLTRSEVWNLSKEQPDKWFR